MYRKDLFDKAGLKMPDNPTWEFIADAAKKITDPADGRLRHLPSRQARLGREHGLSDRRLQFVRRALVRREVAAPVQYARVEEDPLVLRRLDEGRRPPGASANGFNENLALFNAGKCGMWIDATSRWTVRAIRKDSKVADKVGFALAPDTGLGKSANWLWAWSLAIPAGSSKIDAAEKFIAWATNKHYTDLVASKEGWASVPPGTRTSLYKNPEVS